MIGEPKLTSSRVIVFFKRNDEIRKFAEKVEECLGSNYNPPVVIPLPSHIDAPEFPQITCAKKSGFTQIGIAPVYIDSRTSFSEKWAADYDNRWQKCKGYSVESASDLFRMIDSVKALGEPLYFGYSPEVYLEVGIQSEKILFSALSEALVNKLELDPAPSDLNIHLTYVLDDSFYLNLFLSRHGVWEKADPKAQPRLSEEQMKERGILIKVDANDRYSYNNKQDYFSTIKVAEQVIELGHKRLVTTVEALLRVFEVRSSQ